MRDYLSTSPPIACLPNYGALLRDLVVWPVLGLMDQVSSKSFSRLQAQLPMCLLCQWRRVKHNTRIVQEWMILSFWYSSYLDLSESMGSKRCISRTSCWHYNNSIAHQALVHEGLQIIGGGTIMDCITACTCSA